MTKKAVPERADRARAVRTACRVLMESGTRVLPPDPVQIGRDAGVLGIISMTRHAEIAGGGLREYARKNGKNEALTCAVDGLGYLIIYDDAVRSPERIRFSVFHELGHILLGHFQDWDVDALLPEEYRILENEADIFAGNILCPPPIVDLIRGDPGDPKRAALFCVSESAWKIRMRTLAEDRRFLDQRTADEMRIQFRDYLAGRRCRECGKVFTDESRGGRCPDCGSRFLVWNPLMETREEAQKHRRAFGAAAEDLRPGIGEGTLRDPTGYWEMLKREFPG